MKRPTPGAELHSKTHQIFAVVEADGRIRLVSGRFAGELLGPWEYWTAEEKADWTEVRGTCSDQ